MPAQIAPAIGPDFTPEALDSRIRIHEGPQIVEIDYAGLWIRNSAEANAFYDRIEERIAETGEPLWFFLVHTEDYRIDESAWFAYTRRGRDVQQGHSMGTVRWDGSAETRRQIARTAGTDRAVPNLFPDRASALDDLRGRPSQRRLRVTQVPNHHRADIRARVRLEPDADLAHVDFSNLSFEHSRDVNDIYGWLEEIIRPTGRRWYFLVDYTGTRIQSPAWVRFSARSQDFNDRFALGAVRFAPGSETETDIRLRAQSRGIRPNIRNTREEGLARIAELKAEAAQTSR